jgi:bacterioferritin
MKDTQELIRHILFLEGLPNMQRLNRVRIGQDVPEHFNLDLETEREAVDFLTTSIQHCSNVGDFHTREMLEQMVSSEEEHIDWLETQLETIRQVGLENYLSQQIH